jgi:triacylglycerol esterase/lipase EstA (alpha/beta hydrolase family)
LTDGHSPTGYDVSGTLPGSDAPSTEELVLFVHDFHRGEQKVLEEFDRLAGNLASLNVGAPIVGYNWDSKFFPLKWQGIVDVARRNGLKLATFLEAFRAQSPESILRVIGHGLGCHIVLETLTELDRGTEIDSFDMLGPAVHPTAVSFDAEEGETAYGTQLEAHVGEVDNYYKRDDIELGIDVRLVEWYSALGLDGASGETATNYAEHDVTAEVEKHGTFFDIADGCLEDVVGRW